MVERRGQNGVEAAALPIAAVIVAHDSAEVLPDCLRALRKSGLAATIVVDNASDDRSADLAAESGAKVIRLPRNEGFGRAANVGVRAASDEYILILNPDVALEPAAAKTLVEAAARYPDAGLLAPRIVERDGRVVLQPRSLLSPYLDNPRAVRALPEGDVCAPFLSGACFMMRRVRFLELGGFDEAIFLFYEDDDLCRRIADAGLSLVHVHDAIARHGRGKSSAPRPGRIFTSRWHQAWSRAYVARKYGLPSPAFGMAARNGLKALGACLTGRRSIIERYAGSAAGAWAAWRGTSALAREGLER